jgi:precorrin-6Y C5,15-methyltransferase (decarboxylating)
MLQASRLAPLAGGHRLAATNPVIVVVGRRP